MALTLATAPSAFAQRVVYVYQGATGANNGTSWANAYREVRVALANALPGDELWVAIGTYKPTSTGDRSATFQLVNAVELYGGFNGSEVALEERDWTSNLTILSGDIGVVGDSSDNSFHVVTGSGTDSTAVIDGFTITRGRAVAPSTGRGGGMLNVQGSPVVRHCRFYRNRGIAGGGMYNDAGSQPNVFDVVFERNTVGSGGGGMGNRGSSPHLHNVEFLDNEAGNGGAVVNTQLSSLTCIECRFERNTTIQVGSGGAVYSESSASLFVNATFVGNSSRGAGAVVFNDRPGSNMLCINCLFRDNFAENGSGGLFSGEGHPTLINTIFENNSVSGSGGAIFLSGGAIARMYNVVLVGNRSGIEGGALRALSGWFEGVNVTAAGNRAGPAGQAAGAVLFSPGGSTLHNVVLWGNEGTNAIGGSSTVEVTRAIIEGGCTSLMTCASVSDSDPLFVRPPFTDGPADYGDLRLRAGSPAIDAGLASLLPPDTWDLDGDGDTTEPLPIDILGQPRVQGLEVDLGAYEGGVTVAGEPAAPPAGLTLAVSPNPAAGAVTVSLDLPAGGPVNVAVLDVLGRRVATLHAGPLPAGRHPFMWAAGAPAGVYLVRASAQGRSTSRTLTLAR